MIKYTMSAKDIFNQVVTPIVYGFDDGRKWRVMGAQVSPLLFRVGLLDFVWEGDETKILIEFELMTQGRDLKLNGLPVYRVTPSERMLPHIVGARKWILINTHRHFYRGGGIDALVSDFFQALIKQKILPKGSKYLPRGKK